MPKSWNKHTLKKKEQPNHDKCRQRFNRCRCFRCRSCGSSRQSGAANKRRRCKRSAIIWRNKSSWRSFYNRQSRCLYPVKSNNGCKICWNERSWSNLSGKTKRCCRYWQPNRSKFGSKTRKTSRLCCCGRKCHEHFIGI